jgi:4-hydroxy-3-methylbut-2-enyl diphosphate reductase IspH
MTMTRQPRSTARALALALLAAPVAAAACGACIEDKVAATYDHAVVTRAAARHDVVVFAGIEGRGNADALARAVKAAAGRTRGVDRTSIRASADPLAVSFAVDAGAGTPDAIVQAVARSTATPGVKLELLRVVH